MKYESYFREFCKKHGYAGKYKYNAETKHYDIIISKGTDNAGAFLDEAEYEALTIDELQGTLEMLHEGFKVKFNR
ncbi:MAG: hypothetical protein E6600_04535 [Anaerocolumna aminovalerica]|uniref:hypothetical protein n=1 Tax=Anaerocolumna aminovalerica TaxID=1527 RepID=UPI002914FC5F|nr:hypothetical protein [Anaerocolumna aminovalerica]MDU6263749.1 hypothetical protein [Anaerocolumna aminovalerica]